MKRKNNLRYVYAALILIFVIALCIRLLPAFVYPYPIGVDSYYHIRIAKYVLNNGLMTYDPLSFGGRPHLYPPGMHVLLAFFALFMPLETAAEAVPTFIGALSIIAIFYVAKKMYDHKTALLASLFLAFVPVHVWKTASNVLVSAVDITVLLVAVYFLINKNYKYYFLSVVVLLLFSPFVAGFAVILALATINKFRVQEKFILLIFIIFVIIAALFFPLFGNIYVTKDIPEELSTLLYEKPGIDLLFRLNPILIIGVAGIFMHKKQNKLLLLWTILIAVLIAFSLVETDRGLFYISVPLSIYTAYAITNLKFLRRNQLLNLTIILLVAVFSAYLGFTALNNLSWGIMPQEERNALLWLKDNTPQDSTVLATIFEGHWVSAVAERKNVIDGNLIGAPNLTERYNDVKLIYSTQNASLRESLLEKYSIDYILFSGWASTINGKTENFKDYNIIFQDRSVKVFSVNR